MKKGEHIRHYTADELKAKRGQSGTNWRQVDAMTDADLERLIAQDEDEQDLRPDWIRAELVMPESRQSVHLRLERHVIEFFRAHGKGHISRMQAVLKAYVDAHQDPVK
jgi:uncharacterized protein (DUF4415 family)